MRSPRDELDEDRCLLTKVLEVVEEQEQLSALQRRDHCLERLTVDVRDEELLDSERVRDRTQHELGIVNRRKLHEHCPVCERRRVPTRRFEREPRLPRSAGARQDE